MSVHLLKEIPAELPQECKRLKKVSVRLIAEDEHRRFDQRLEAEHGVNAEEPDRIARSISPARASPGGS